MPSLRVICICNRELVRRDFWQQFALVLAARPEAIILRAKELGESDYSDFARIAIERSKSSDVKLILHNFPAVALDLDHPYIHLPFSEFEKLKSSECEFLSLLGVSVHSLEEAQFCEQAGADYLLAGNIFETECKPGLAGKGLAYLSELRKKINTPMYGIGGIRPANVRNVMATGVAGVALMSPFMQADDPHELMNNLQKGSQHGR